MSKVTDEPSPRAAVVYESMFGCTEAVARAVADGLIESGYAVTLDDVGNLWSSESPPFDLLVVGAPTHAFSLSRRGTRQEAMRQGGRPKAEAVGLRDWLAALGRRETAGGRPFAAFDTRVSKVRHLPKAASTRAAHLLAHQGYRSVSRPTAFIVDDTRGPLAEGELARAHEWGLTVGRTAAALRPSTSTAAG